MLSSGVFSSFDCLQLKKQVVAKITSSIFFIWVDFKLLKILKFIDRGIFVLLNIMRKTLKLRVGF